MCGISGIYSLSGNVSISEQAIRRMVSAISHRGPDGAGMYLDDRAGLGHARLSIIDLAGGAQPIHNEDESLWIIFNGEIFNYPELRNGLIERGHRFLTSTDTEVILHLYEEHGPECLELLNGQFAIAIWNRNKKELFLARDRFGILPLHYTVSDNSLIFASEIKAIFTVSGVSRQIDPLAMDQLFTFWTTLPGSTIFKDIHELPPGHWMTVSNGRISLNRYWDVPLTSPDQYWDYSENRLTESLLDLISDAVRIRLRADVPVGCYVSGGLDSSGITALVKNRFQNELRTFGIRFEDKAYDESDFQQHLVDELGTAHTDMLARNDEIGALLDTVLWHCEKPLLRTAPVPLFQLAQEVRKNGYKVVLTGEGADEVFGGYDIFREAKILRFWAKQPGSTSRPRLFERIYPYIFQKNPRARHFVRSFFGASMKAIDDPFFSHLVRWNATGKIKTFFSKDLSDTIHDYSCLDKLKHHLPEHYDSWDYLSKAQYLEMTLFMSNYLLSSQGDRIAMAHSVEVRPPFLDHRLMEFMGRVPLRLRISGLNEKYLLKKAFEGIVPKRILGRQKHPYRAPISSSLFTPGNSWIEQFLSEDALSKTGLFDHGKVARLVTKIKMRVEGSVESEFDNMALAGILTTQMLYHRFITMAPGSAWLSAKDFLVYDRRNSKT